MQQKVIPEDLETTDADLLMEGFKESFAGFLVRNRERKERRERERVSEEREREREREEEEEE